MRVLLKDLARNASVSSQYETVSYPASNIIDVFLDTLFISAMTSDVVTIDLGGTYDINSLFIAGCTAPTVDYAIVSDAMGTVKSGTITIARDVEDVLFTTVQGRYITLTMSVASGYIKIKGFGCGVAESFPELKADLVPTVGNDTSFTRTKTGQVLRNPMPSFLGYSLSIPKLSLIEMKAILRKLDTLGIHWPTYWDMAEETDDFHDPLYAEISEPWKVEKTNNSYNVNISILEAR